MSDFYDRDGKPLELMEWAKLFEDGEYRIVERTEIGEVTVSTVWLGLDHSFSRIGPPVIFETMVFGGPHDGEADRYRTLDEARKGHEAMVEKVSKAPTMRGPIEV